MEKYLVELKNSDEELYKKMRYLRDHTMSKEKRAVPLHQDVSMLTINAEAACLLQKMCLRDTAQLASSGGR
jgi:hypothetical protein